MKRGEVGFEGIGVGEGESLFVEGANKIEDVESPAAHFGAEFFERADAGILFSRELRTCRFAIRDEMNPGIRWNFCEQDVAAYPTVTTGRRGEWPTFFDCGNRKCEMRDEESVLDFPVCEFVMERDEIGRSVLADFLEHRRIRGVNNFAPERMRLGFELE